MIVFTITNNESDRVFVASSRNAPEDRWEQLITQAQEGSEGEIFDEIRRHDADVFSVEEWGFGEDPKEIRQLMREAQHDLGAIVVNTGKVDALPSAKRKKLTDREASKLLEDIERSLASDNGDDLIPTPSMSAEDEAASDDTFSSQNPSPADSEAPSSTTPKTSSPRASDVKESKSQDATSTKRVDRTESLIEQLARKVEREKVAAQAQKLSAKKAASATKPATGPKTIKDKPVKDKLPTGRMSSRAKEQQIRERIDKEREERAQAKQAAERREAVQMSKVIASIELRRKTQKPTKAKAKPAAKTTTLTKAKKAEKPEKTTLSRSTTAKKTVVADTEQLTQALIKTGFIEKNEPVEKPAEPLFDRAMAIKSAKALNEIIRAKRAQQYAPKAPVEPKKRESISNVQDKRLQRMIEKEKAMLEAKKAAMTSSSANEMAEIVARIDSRSQDSSRTLRRR
ncbi:hypothetical protein [Alkalimarinus coralli]|uniref:hypothetical protein n=1 Tax=Alkalimarinus coralli TaxID=2935863 RepID=UPI00202B1439|nr:hypothetical protein [Alkalimarinus coralli]